MKKNTFRQQLYRKLKMVACIGLGIAAIAVIKSRLRWTEIFKKKITKLSTDRSLLEYR